MKTPRRYVAPSPDMLALQQQIGRSPNRDWYAQRLDALGPHASPLQRQRLDVAIAYLERHHTTQSRLPNGTVTRQVDRDQVLQQLDSIDFHKEVKLVQLQRHDQLRQFAPLHAPTGQFFSNPGTPQQSLAIASGQGASQRVSKTYFVQQDMVVLQTHTRGTIDTWTTGRLQRQPHNSTLNKGQPIQNLDRPATRGQLTPEAGKARSIYSAKNAGANNSTSPRYQHRSGEFVRGGGTQYHVPKQLHRNLSSPRISHAAPRTSPQKTIGGMTPTRQSPKLKR